MKGFPLQYPPSLHECRIEEFFARAGGEAIECGTWLEPGGKSYSHYAICFVNRSGSNLLARALWSSGRFGLADEYFNYHQVASFAKQHGVKSLAEYAVALRRSSAANGTFGTKLAWPQLYYLTRTGIIPNVYEDLKYVLIERRDTLGQAISFSIADQTKNWRSQDDVGPVNYRFDPEDIFKRIRGITNAYARFKAYFAMFGIEPVYVSYEDLDRDLVGTVARVIGELGLPGTMEGRVNQGAIGLSRQRGGLNQRVREAFLRHTGADRWSVDLPGKPSMRLGEPGS